MLSELLILKLLSKLKVGNFCPHINPNSQLWVSEPLEHSTLIHLDKNEHLIQWYCKMYTIL